MMTKTLSKTLMAASLIVALGAVGVAPAMAGAALQNDAASDTSMSTKVSDTWITTKVKSEFATTKGVSATQTSVDTKDGVVMLTGTVDSQAEKQMAIQTARSVKGVRAVQADKLMVDAAGSGSMNHDSMGSGAMSSGSMGSDSTGSSAHHSMSSDTSLETKTNDTWITTKVKSDFATTKGVDVTDVSVETKAGVVMLSGTVGSRAEKQIAIKTARSVKGVSAVHASKLKVSNHGDSMKHDSTSGDSTNNDGDHTMSSGTSLATKASDTWITTKVKSEFATTKGVNVTDVSVDTKAGVVMLSGTVDSVAEKQLAIKSARSVEGVKAVEAGKLMVGKSGM
ncbi:MAG: BON domain-containing protein [Pseudomonadota bacterium]|nr:BON domain-containing protein [Pseudomonadota bacterium]